MPHGLNHRSPLHQFNKDDIWRAGKAGGTTWMSCVHYIITGTTMQMLLSAPCLHRWGEMGHHRYPFQFSGDIGNDNSVRNLT